MKKVIAIPLAVLLAVGSYGAVAAGGGAEDPLVSLGYLNQNYLPETVKTLEERVGKMGTEVYRAAAEQLKGQAEYYLSKVSGGSVGEHTGGTSTFQEMRLKREDTLSVGTGSSVLLLAGEAVITSQNGAVIDATEGTEIPSGSAMIPNHRYIVGEDALCKIVVSTDTAVLAPQGAYQIDPSDAVDYNELADALKEMGVLKGSSTGYGSGYELELQPTRIQGLIMFLRLIGEEEQARTYGGEVPFSDVPEWCRNYVAYANDKKYMMGYGDGRFGTDNHITAKEYVTVLLRALGYQDKGDTPDFTFDSVLPRARELGVLTAAEETLLDSGTFLRSHLVYLSYYGLTTPIKGGSETLLDRLSQGGVVDQENILVIMSGVSSQRLE